MTEAAIRTEDLACSEAAAAAGEPLAGTASEAPLFAALSWPKARWHPDKAALSEGLPPAVGALEKLARETGRKLQLRLFERPGDPGGPGVEVLCADFAAGRSLQLRAADAEAAARAVAEFVRGGDAGPPIAGPLALVCTDGRHDRCCGKLGRSLAAALGGSLEVAEASHLGGHRLAANCLVLPTGRLYGRVTAADVPGLVAAVRRGEVYLPCYRGRTGLSELEQVAEAAALAEFPRARSVVVKAPGSGVATVAVAVDGMTVDVSSEQRDFVGIASCGDSEPETRKRWVATLVQTART
jgi:hypothetical protein